MKEFLVLSLLLMFSSVFSQNSTIKWGKEKKLTWEDFKAKPNEDAIGTAKTSYKINIIPENVKVDEQDRIEGYKKISVVATFYKNLSWTREALEGSNLLKHEQLHFDIAELFARKIRMKFKELQQKNEARFSIYQQEYSKLWKQCRLYQKEYDFETKHGIKLDLNKSWTLKVNKELSKLQGI